MRIIGYLNNGREALEFSHFLTREGISNQIDPEGDHFGVWVIDEDRLSEAMELFDEFQKNPKEAKYAIHLAQSTPKTQRSSFSGSFKMGTLTLFLLLIATLLFIIGSTQAYQIKGVAKISEDPLVNTPVYLWLLYDVPAKVPYWKGFYGELIAHTQHQPSSLFEQIREGQVWRIFTPALLHGNFFHLLFNGIWILVLGNQVEGRIKKVRYALFCLLVAGLSNTAQYLMSGPFFFGLSGIVCALFGFIWMRQRQAPWEGYQLHRAVTILIFIYIGALAGLSLISFVAQMQGFKFFNIGIANTAHIVGLAGGMLFGRMNFFALQEDL